MDNEDLTSHVDEIMEVIGDRATREEISEELEKYISVFRLNLQTAKRTIVKRFSDSQEDYRSSTPKKLGEIQPGEMSVNFVGKIISVNEKDIQSRGERKRIIYGLIGDETATHQYTVWEIPEPMFERGDVVSIRNAYTKEYNGKLQLNFGSRTGIKRDESTEIKLQEMPIGPTRAAKIGEIGDIGGSVEVTGRILSIEKKIIGGEAGPREILTGMMGDDTGRIRFTSWGDSRLREDDVVRISGANVRFWKSIPQISFDDRAEITRIKDDFPSSEELMKSSVTEISKLVEGSGGIDISVEGVILQIKEGSGLIFRCPECKRVLQKGSCRIHGKIEGTADLRVKAVVDDGTGAIVAIMNREITEELIEMSIDECLERAREMMDYDAISEILEDKLISRPVEVRGNVTVDDYGPMMIAQSANLQKLDVREKVEKLLIQLEESE